VEKQTNISALDFIKKIENFGVSRIIYTDINKDGTKKAQILKTPLNYPAKLTSR
jgi:phosphoribosylformimino-5-aminoimidazole carboxamide ribotide isomerase